MAAANFSPQKEVVALHLINLSAYLTPKTWAASAVSSNSMKEMTWPFAMVMKSASSVVKI